MLKKKLGSNKSKDSSFFSRLQDIRGRFYILLSDNMGRAHLRMDNTTSVREHLILGDDTASDSWIGSSYVCM